MARKLRFPHSRKVHETIDGKHTRCDLSIASFDEYLDPDEPTTCRACRLRRLRIAKGTTYSPKKAKQRLTQVFRFKNADDARAFDKHAMPGFTSLRRGSLVKITYSTTSHNFERAMRLNLHDAVNIWGARVMTKSAARDRRRSRRR